MCKYLAFHVWESSKADEEMNGGHAPTSATQIKEAELNVHKETSQLKLQFHCEGAAINHKPVFNVGHQSFQLHSSLEFPTTVVD